MSGINLNDVFARIAEMKTRASRRYVTNKDSVMRSMKRHAIPKLRVFYSGGGDSGCVEGVEFVGLSDDDVSSPQTIKVSIAKVTSRFADGTWIDEEVKARVSLYEAAETFAYDWLEANHPGWENNDGADGEIIFDLEAGKVFLTHNSHYTETDTTQEEL